MAQLKAGAFQAGLRGTLPGRIQGTLRSEVWAVWVALSLEVARLGILAQWANLLRQVCQVLETHGGEARSKVGACASRWTG